MEKPKRINNLTYLKSRRRDLRNNGTPAEATLWKALQKKQLDGKKFRRQHSIGNYILDFYCPAERLGLELDGDSHYSPECNEYDQQRAAFLAELGIKIIRFENKMVFENLEGVLEEIRKYINKED
ncbi:MAG: endonuclease domain-containing protein [Calditrichaeota bacterium]|nr:MAG: endonuclease domain-containing protein [Calditrichota bacterium]